MTTESDDSYEAFLAWRGAKQHSLFVSRSVVAGGELQATFSAMHGPGRAADDPLQKPLDAVPLENAPAAPAEPEYGPPKDISMWRLFLIFLGFGARAWGGPTVQIDMMREEMCIERRWIEPQKFNRVYGIYQVLPGPEATELACYFGLLARGRLGSLVSGLGFVLPGFVLMLLLSWIVFDYGASSLWFKACVAGVVPAVVALVFRGTEKIAQHFLLTNNDKASKVPLLERWYNVWLFVMVIFTCVQAVVRINFFISLGVAGVLAVLAFTEWPCFARVSNERLRLALRLALPIAWMALCVGMFVLYVVLTGALPSANFVAGVASEPTYGSLFVLGLLAGLLTFGGAATAIPFVYSAAVLNGHWCSEAQFLTAIALGSIIPSPLVIFVLYVGFVGARWGGAILITLGMFIPAFTFTLVIHGVIDRLFKFQTVLNVVDGITTAVVGLLAVTAFSLLSQAVVDHYSTALLVMALAACYYFNHKLLVPMIIVTAVIAGLVGYAPLIDSALAANATNTTH
jgi:chromate transporter